MDPTDENDDLFADLYGDDEPTKPAAEQPKPKPVERPQTTLPVSVPTAERPAQAAAAPARAVDPRAPQPPTQALQEEQYSRAGDHEQQQQQLQQQEYSANQAGGYGNWNASEMGHGAPANDNSHNYDNNMGTNGSFHDQGAGTPAIKEDGCVS